MRKKAQEKKKAISQSSSSSSISSSSSTSNSPTVEFAPATETKGRSFYDTGGMDLVGAPAANMTGVEVEESTKVYSMDEIWKDIELSEESSNFTCQAMNSSPIWDFCPTDSLWSMGEEESKMLMQHMGDHFHSFPFYNHMTG